jgi:hypothetical protein
MMKRLKQLLAKFQKEKEPFDDADQAYERMINTFTLSNVQ